MSPSNEGRVRARPKPGLRVIAGRVRWAAAFSGSAILFSTCTSEQVTLVSVSSVDVLPPSVNTVQGDRIQLHATVLDEHGQPLPGAPVAWSTTDPAIASVDPAGVLVAHAVGSVEASATFGEVSGSVPVVVTAGPLIAVGRDSVALFGAAGGSPPEPQVLSVFNAGSGAIDGLSASAVYPEGFPNGWLDAVLASPAAPTSLSLAAQTSALGTGVYRAEVLIAADEVTNSPVAVKVALTISGFAVTESGGTVVTEAGGTDSFTAVLGSRPRSEVVLSVASTDLGEVTVTPASLTFTPASWDVPQSVTVTGVDDTVDDGDQTTTVTVEVNDMASDEAFDDLPDRGVSVATLDDDATPPPPPPPPPPPTPTPGVQVTQSGGTTAATEGGPTDAFTVRLLVQPASNVVLTVTSANTAEATVSPGTLTFTPANWNTDQSVTVAAVDDAADDGDRATTVTVAVNDAASDNAYDPVADQTLTAATIDNDAAPPPPPPPPPPSPGILISQSGGTTTAAEGGATDAFTVRLQSQPATDVVLSVTSANTAEATVSPGSLTFTPTNWSTLQSVTLTAVDDTADDGDRATTVTVAVNDAASDDVYDGVADLAFTVATIDNDDAPPPPPTPGFVITQSGGSTSATEGGATDAFTVRLQSQPASNVVLIVTSANTTEATVGPNLLTFTPASWNADQAVTVGAVDDFVDDGDGSIVVTISVNDATSDDAYDAVPDQTLTVTTVDNDATPAPIATRLDMTQQPPSVQPQLSSFAVAVVAVDANGDTVPSYTGPVTLSILNDASLLGNARLVGATTVNAVNGVATFAGVRVDQLGVGYTLRANAPDLIGVTSIPFTVVL